jgi:hypothetical protein
MYRMTATKQTNVHCIPFYNKCVVVSLIPRKWGILPWGKQKFEYNQVVSQFVLTIYCIIIYAT